MGRLSFQLTFRNILEFRKEGMKTVASVLLVFIMSACGPCMSSGLIGTWTEPADLSFGANCKFASEKCDGQGTFTKGSYTVDGAVKKGTSTLTFKEWTEGENCSAFEEGASYACEYTMTDSAGDKSLQMTCN